MSALEEGYRKIFLNLRLAWAIYSKIPVVLGEPGKEKGWVVWTGMAPIDSCA